MRIVLTTVLLKVFAREFYSRNAMFFLVVMGLCFGFMSGAEHKALASFFISSPLLLTIPVVIWILYACKVVVFNRRALSEPRNAFTHHITLLGRSTQWSSIFPVLTMQFAPVLGYAFFLFLISIQHHSSFAMICVVLSVCTLLCVSVTALYYDLKNQYHEKKIHAIKRLVDARFSMPYVQFFLGWISRKDPAVLLGTKSFCCLLLFGILKLYTTDAYDWRLLGIGLIIVFSGNMPLLFHLHRFENFDFQIVRNLPISLSRRLLNNVLLFALLCLPEFGILIGNFPAELSHINLILSILFSLSLLIFLYSWLYALPADLEKFTRKVFAFSMIEIVVVLFGVPLWVIVLVNFTGGALLFKKYFYVFEITANSKQQYKHLEKILH